MVHCIAPPFLCPGDCIGLAAPARKVTEKELGPCVELIEKQGFKVKFASNIGKTDGQFSGSDAQRAEGINELISDPNVKAVLCARGGYGSVRTFSHLNLDAWRQNPTWICGFSDVTALHLLSRSELKIQSIHSPVATTLPSASEEAKNSFFNALSGNLKWDFKGSVHALSNAQCINGQLVGGNLSLIYSLMGSKYTHFNEDNIMLFEDLDEMLYHLDRVLMGLKLAGVFKHTKAIVVGGLSDFRDNTKSFGFEMNNPYGKNPSEIVLEQLGELGIPIVFNAPFGHLTNNESFYHAAQASLEWRGDQIKLSY